MIMLLVLAIMAAARRAVVSLHGIVPSSTQAVCKHARYPRTCRHQAGMYTIHHTITQLMILMVHQQRMHQVIRIITRALNHRLTRMRMHKHHLLLHPPRCQLTLRLRMLRQLHQRQPCQYNQRLYYQCKHTHQLQRHRCQPLRLMSHQLLQQHRFLHCRCMRPRPQL